MENGTPTGEYEDFMTGFALDNDRVWGRRRDAGRCVAGERRRERDDLPGNAALSGHGGWA
jgi:hypothetical protein